MNSLTKSAFAFAIGSIAATAVVPQALANPFAMADLASGYQIDAPEGKCGEGKCGEGKCGADKKSEPEGKCGEGKCGAEKKGEQEGKCGGDKKAAGEGKCGAGA